MDKCKTTFTTHFGTYIFKRMPLRLKNAPSTFQGMIDIILTTVKWKQVLVYLDDIIVFSPTIDEHFSHVKQVLSLLHNAEAMVRLGKSKFFQTEIDYLGPVMMTEELVMEPEMSKAVSKANPPTNVR